MTILIGFDVGQRREPTGLCVVELEERRGGGRAIEHFLVRRLERLPAGTPYPVMASRLARIGAGILAKTRQRPWVYVDATGLGDPIIDLLREEGRDLGRLWPVYFTHGDLRSQEGRKIRLGKAYLVSRLQMLLQTERLHLPRTPEAEQLAGDLRDFEIEVDEGANDRAGAFRVGSHDDLVTALGLAVHHVPPTLRIL